MPLKKKPKFLVSEPRVFVVGVQRVVQKNLRAFLRSEGFPEWKSTSDRPSEVLPEVAGRVCYLSFGKGRPHDEYVENLKRERHGSVLEHAVVSFILTGVSRSFTHECVRHRAGWAYSQLSQRFVDEREAQYVVPWAIRRYASTRKLFRELAEANQRGYAKLKETLIEANQKYKIIGSSFVPRRIDTRTIKLVNGAARSVLANATETKIFCTVNARALRHFLEMRANVAADHEIRMVAMAIYYAVLEYMPDLLSDYVVEKDEDGVEYLRTEFVKV
jgi:thymidylate synthase (FAD)